MKICEEPRFVEIFKMISGFFLKWTVSCRNRSTLYPCIMCVYNVCAVPWGCSVPRGDIMYHDKCGGYLEYCGGVRYHGGYHEHRGGYLEYHGECSVLGGYHDARGGYHECHGGCSVSWGENLLLFEYPTILNIPTVLMISPTCIMISPTVLKFQKMVSPHSTEHPPWCS